MNIQQFKTHEELSQASAEYVFQKIKQGIEEKGSFNLGLATGASPKRTYEIVIEKLGESKLDLSNFHTFNLDEYHPMWQGHKRSYFQEMYQCFWKPLNAVCPTFEIPNGHILNGENPKAEFECRIYEKMIQKAGGIDLQILGLGINGHIGFNEPGSVGNSRTRQIDLTAETREANKKYFDDDLEKVPTHGLTMGIETILEAKEIVMIVTGENKKDIFEKMKKLKKPTPKIPASFLLTHPKTAFYSDPP
ncbi:glucosamine-6-phosphate deaminase [Candidatus Woesebacteria bacterium]|nr:glucosamine-6-phosphate deaminase [Candidatus Woesebacteria bacterium]